MGKTLTTRHLTIPPTYMETVGAVVFYWATLEHELVDLIGTAMRLDKKQRRILMAHMDPKAKLAMLKVVASKYVRMPDTRAKVINLGSACGALYKARNLFAHGAWVHPSDNSSKYELLVIESGEDAFLPRRMEMDDSGRANLVAHFAQAVQFANALIREVGAQVGPPQDAEGGEVTSESEPPESLVVPDEPH